MVVSEFGGDRQRRLEADLAQEIDDGTGQAPLGDGDAVRNEEANQQNGEIAEPELGEIRDREREGADELGDRPARGDPAGGSRKKRKPAVRIDQEKEYRHRKLSRDESDSDDQETSGRHDADDLADLAERARQGGWQRRGHSDRHDGKRQVEMGFRGKSKHAGRRNGGKDRQASQNEQT